jgi:glycosyl transferase, family 25
MRAEIRVISLPTARDRRVNMHRQLETLSLPWAFFDAGYPLPDFATYDVERSRVDRLRTLSPGELGYCSSNLRLWHWFLNDADFDVLCVLCDDVAIDPFFFDKLSDIAPLMKHLNYIKLYAMTPGTPTYIGPIKARHLIRYRKPTYGGQGYVITREGARRLLEAHRVFTRPMDEEIDRYWANGLPAYCVYPFPLIEVSFSSSISPGAAERIVFSELPGRYWRLLQNKSAQTIRHWQHRLVTDRVIRTELERAPSAV